MKTVNSGRAVLLAAFILQFVATCVAQLPDRLPIGSQQEMREWIVTNRTIHIDIKILYTNTSGYVEGPTRTGSYLTFTSYAQYREVVLTNCMAVLENLKKRTNIASSLRYLTTTFYAEEAPVVGITIDTNIGYLSPSTATSISNAPMKWEFVCMKVPGVQSFAIQVDTSPPYSNMWDTVLGQTYQDPDYPIERGRTNFIVLLPWYSVGDYRARFTVVHTNGTRKVYTQAGDSVNPAQLKVVSDKLICLSVSRGSDTYIESSPDLTHWSPVASVMGTIPTNTLWLPYTTTGSRQFFRTRSE
ncbi:MAG: hypothetical protein V4481_04345 [Patescibacteria group bacterium]